MKKNLDTQILEILSKQKVRNQTNLAKILASRDIPVDQSTLSRILRKLGIQKKDGFYHLLEKKQNNLTITPSPPNLIVIKTLPGHAHAIAYQLDNNPPPGLIGTVAGDDTVLCIVENSKFLKSICHHLSFVQL